MRTRRTYSDARSFLDTVRKGKDDPETLERALDCYQQALDWASDTGECHFCGYDHPTVPHSFGCPLFGLK